MIMSTDTLIVLIVAVCLALTATALALSTGSSWAVAGWIYFGVMWAVVVSGAVITRKRRKRA